MIYDNLGVAEQGKVMTEGGLTHQFNAQLADCFSPLPSVRMTWRRFGSLRCLSRIADRWKSRICIWDRGF